MIAQIRGTVTEITEYSVILQVDGVGYELLVPGSVIEGYKKRAKAAIEQNGEGTAESKDIFYTIQYIEGASGHGNQFVRLVGFRRKIEKDFFQLYTSVEGIGYKTALKSLILPIQKIALAIERSDLATLRKLPHIGQRTAEKMVATLKGRMQRFALDLQAEPLTVEAEEDFHSEVLQVLKQIGYTDAEAIRLVDKALKANPKVDDAEAMIQEIFKLQSAKEPIGQ